MEDPPAGEEREMEMSITINYLSPEALASADYCTSGRQAEPRA